MSPDVVIVGAGVSGLTTAIALSEAGLRVDLLDRGPVARESTWAGAGILSLLLPWHYSEPVIALAEQGRRLWPQWLSRLESLTGLDAEYRTSGMLVMDTGEITAARCWGERYGWSVQTSPPEFAQACPPAADAIWLPEVAQVRNPRLTRVLEAAARMLGVRITPHCPVLGLDIHKGKLMAVLTPAGRVPCAQAIICAGAWSRLLLGRWALEVQILPVRGQILLLAGRPGLLPSIVYRAGRYLVPRADGHILVGSTLEQVGFDRSTTDEAGHALHTFALDSCPCLRQTRVIRQWAGLRPGSTGNLPTIARHPEVANLYLNAGHFRYGVTMAPAAAGLIAALVTGTAPMLDLTPYAWRRADPA